ncbi:MAG: hypothetical protein HYY60_01545 [Parcubacteria group bacterium]|nr:hypothetical protein [Parcubacteria group bacterium]MBI3075232.1 hypothetical protein [Parcubacteria group bacterium]
MAKTRVNLKLQVTFLKEGDQFVAYSAPLDLSTCGETLEEARRRFSEAALLFIQELNKKGTLEQVLSELGWKQKNSSFIPPLIIGQENYSIPLHA